MNWLYLNNRVPICKCDYLRIGNTQVGFFKFNDVIVSRYTNGKVKDVFVLDSFILCYTLGENSAGGSRSTYRFQGDWNASNFGQAQLERAQTFWREHNILWAVLERYLLQSGKHLSCVSFKRCFGNSLLCLIFLSSLKTIGLWMPQMSLFSMGSILIRFTTCGCQQNLAKAKGPILLRSRSRRISTVSFGGCFSPRTYEARSIIRSAKLRIDQNMTNFFDRVFTNG